MRNVGIIPSQAGENTSDHVHKLDEVVVVDLVSSL